MADRRKKPPTFHHLPKSRAHRLKKAWIEDHKIRSKWKAEKRRGGLTIQASVQVEDIPGHAHNDIKTDSKTVISPNHPNKPPTPSRDKQSLRELRKIAYGPKPLPTPKPDSPCLNKTSRHNNRGGTATLRRETGQPNMKVRMNTLLEKIRRDIS